jgi:hypothetical protein
MRLWRNHGPRLLLAGGFVLLLVAGILAVTLRPSRTTIKTVTVTVPSRTTTQTTTTAPPTTTTQPPPPPPPTQVAMSWDNAGGIVWHPAVVDPAWLGQQMRAAGFGWVAVYLGENDSTTPPDTNWIARFRAASGLPVGAWSVLGVDPAKDATQAAQLIDQDGLAFYIADAEAPYGYTDGTQHSATRLKRSQIFVSTFRRAEPNLPAAVSSYCRPDQHDIDWAAWAHGGFVFLPQAYVNDFGDAAAPAACVSGAASYFPKSQVHPTVGSYSGVLGIVDPTQFAQLLAQAGTTGFSIYPAEAGMSAENWQAYGQAIATLHIANRVQ